MAMTAATPMIMPSIVSAVRILLRFSALRAIRNVMKIDMRTLQSTCYTTAAAGRAAISSAATRRSETM